MTEFFVDDGRLDPGAAELSFEEGSFVFGEPLPAAELARSSSGKKLVYRGVYLRRDGDATLRLPARAIFFDRGSQLDYARERNGLTLGALLGIGPRMLEADTLRPVPGGSGAPVPVIVEEDAGVSLEDALRGVRVPLFVSGEERAGIRLPAPRDPEGRRMAHKILLDVLSQVSNLQSRGLFHRDVRSANVALRFHERGDALGLRATLLDLEFLTGRPRGRVSCSAYYDRLFEGGVLGRPPTPLEQDAGYLSILMVEVLEGLPVGELTDSMVDAALRRPWSLLVVSDGEAFARRVSSRDLARGAEAAGVPTAGAVYGGISERAVTIAEDETMHGGYVDELDRQRLERSLPMILERETVERLARGVWEGYVAHRVRDGLPVEYGSFEDQPDDLRESCLAQARHMREKVEMLGYEIVAARDCPGTLRVGELSGPQVEYLAEMEHERWVREREAAGWTYGAEKDVERRVSPYLVPWEELEDAVREYDREPVRELVALIESVGLALRRYC